MKITLVQTALFWEDREKNISHFSKLIDSVKEQTDVIVLPEMFTTGFTMKPEQVAETNEETLSWLKQKAKEKNAIMTGSVSVKDNENFFNRLYWAEPSGKYQTYDKRHLFRIGKEDAHYTAGTKKIIVSVNDWKICPLICYDLRFPVWSRNRFNKTTCTWDYDVLIYIANWPEVRNYPWKQLLIARAIENQCYVVGVNRIGSDGNNIPHTGDSVVINPRGEIISHTKANEESVETVSLDKNYLEEFRKIFPVGMDADEFGLGTN